MKLATGFAGGMALQGEVCGAVMGAFMLISLKHGRVDHNDIKSKDRTYELMQEFTRRFKAKKGSIICRELLGDIPLTGDSSIFIDKYVNLCPLIVRDAAELVEELLFGSYNSTLQE